MKDKLYKFLKSKGGCASSVEIVGQLFNMRGAHRHVAEKVVAGWTKNHPVFISDGLGNWYIDPQEDERGSALKKVVFNLLEIKGDAKSLAASALLQIGICQIQDGKIIDKYFATTLRIEQNARTELVLFDQIVPWQEVLNKLLPWLEAGVLTSFYPAPARNFVCSEALRVCGVYLALQELSLKKLSQKIFPQEKIKTRADMARALNTRYFETEELDENLSNLAELHLSLMERCEEMGLDTLEKILEFQQPDSQQVKLADKKIHRAFLEKLPEGAGVYIMKDRDDAIIYVGKAKNLKKRVLSYFVAREHVDKKLAEIWDRIFDLEIIELGSELEAFIEEQKLIRKYQPEINLKLQVHDSANKLSFSKDILLFLPSRKSNSICLFCVNAAGRSKRFQIPRKKELAKKVLDVLQKFYFSANTRKPGALEQEQSELIWRWFAQNRDQVSWLDMKEMAELSECVRLIDLYKQGQSEQTGRIIYR